MLAPEIAFLRQLCRLEIPGTLLASVLFQELKNVIPCDAMTLFWQEPASPATHFFHESDTEVNCGSTEAQFLGRMCFAANPELCAVFSAGHPMLGQIADLFPGVQEVAEQNFQTLAVGLPDKGKRTGAILLHRSFLKPFATMEKALLVRLAPILSSSLCVNTEPPQLITNENNAGILLLDRSRKIQYSCCRGRKLIQLAQAPFHPARRTACDDDLDGWLRRNFGSESFVHPANFVFQNGWGSFEFFLHQLSDSEIQSDQLTAVAVHRQEPLVLSVLRGCKKLALTEKQIEIALQLIKGLSYDAVAAKLGIRATTVVDHVRKIYEKTGVGNRSELVTALLLGIKKMSSMCVVDGKAGEGFRIRSSRQLNESAHVTNKMKGTLRGYAL